MEFQIFSSEQFGQIRAVILEDAPWFVGRDIALILGYVKTESAIKRHVAKADKSVALVPINQSTRRRMTIINESGLYALVRASKLPVAEVFRDWIINELNGKTKSEGSQVLTVKGVRLYQDVFQTIWFNAEDVARGLGFVEDKKFSTSGENYVRWERLNSYLADYSYPPIKADDYLPENMVYRLAMKANNQTAKAFQTKIADEILPTLRKTGSYSLKSKEPVIDEKKSCVYVLGMNSALTKIGMTGDILERARIIERQSGAQVERIYNSVLMNREAAAALEKFLHDKFADKRREGEFFDVPFEDACRALVLATSELPIALPELPLVDKLISIADKMEPCPQRQQILIRAANLLDAHFTP